MCSHLMEPSLVPGRDSLSVRALTHTKQCVPTLCRWEINPALGWYFLPDSVNKLRTVAGYANECQLSLMLAAAPRKEAPTQGGPLLCSIPAMP